MAATVLIIDDEQTLNHFVQEDLREAGYESLGALTGQEGLDLIRSHEVDLVLLDQQLPDMHGLDVLKVIREEEPDIPVIIVTGHGEIDCAVQAMKLGAYDYMKKPYNLDTLLLVAAKALEASAMRREIRRLRRETRNRYALTWIVGETPQMKAIAQLLMRVAPTNASVLLQGESGTGKEVVANAIHQQSNRAERAFVALNCAAIPDALLESELFGYEPGAFTGAHKQKKGLIEAADGGTLFLDEISGMKPEMQTKLLRVLETRTLRRVGGTRDIKVDIRIIAASNQDLVKAIREGTFREDLYYRLGVVTVNLPPLRERIVDLPLFIAAFIDDYNQSTGRNITGVSADALRLLKAYSWPGNIRELRNVVERAVILCDGDEIRPQHLPAEIVACQPSPMPATAEAKGDSVPPNGHGLNLKEAVARLEEDLIRRALALADGNQTRAANTLGISRDELRYRLRKYQLE
ncbi:MAG: sigma-54-dependent Fis family transcriptional regulator [Chloroflexi bacterium]|nr:sigma-54-dependent Fis family transcriptional regulator [Chloroflexota bacterium]